MKDASIEVVERVSAERNSRRQDVAYTFLMALTTLRADKGSKDPIITLDDVVTAWESLEAVTDAVAGTFNDTSRTLAQVEAKERTYR